MRRIRTALVLVLLLSMSACRLFGSDTYDDDDLGSLGKALGFTFPPGTQLLGTLREEPMDGIVYRCKVTVPKTAWPAFETALPIPRSKMLAGPVWMPGPFHGFWEFAGYPALRSGYKNLPGGKSIRIAVDDSRPDVVTMFALKMTFP